MKRIQICVLTLLLYATTGVYGQTTSPANVTLDSKNYYRHGFNGDGPNITNPDNSITAKPQELRDSVTVTSVMKYFVLPDPLISPEYTVNNIEDFNEVNSTFSWQFRRNGGAALGSVTTSTASNEPVLSVTWNGTGVDSLVVKEVPNLAANAACAGSETVIPVAVVMRPTITFNINGSVYGDSACYKETVVDAGLSLTFPIIMESESSQIEVDYKIEDPDGNVLESPTNVRIPMGGNIANSIKFNKYGRYTITVSKITDRVSRKSTDASGNPISGTVANSGSLTYTYHVMKPVQTGPIYRIPNNY